MSFFFLQECPERGEERPDSASGWADLWEGGAAGGDGGRAAGQDQAGGQEQRAGGGTQKVRVSHHSQQNESDCLSHFPSDGERITEVKMT